MDGQFPFGGPKGAGVGARGRGLSPLDPLTYFASTGMAFAHAFAGRYDEAISWATKALHEQPNGPRHCGWRRWPMLFRIG